MSEQMSSEDKGCMFVLGIVALGFVATALIELLKTLVLVAIVGAGLYFLYRFSQTSNFDELMDNISLFFSKKVNATHQDKTNTNGKKDQGTDNALLEGINRVADGVDGLRKDMVAQKGEIIEEVSEMIDQKIDQYDKKTRSNNLNDLFTEEAQDDDDETLELRERHKLEVDYSKSDQIKKEEATRQMQQRELDLKQREFEQSIDKKVLDMKTEIVEQNNFMYTFANKVGEELLSLKIGFNERFDYLNQKHDNLANFVQVKYSELSHHINTEVSKIWVGIDKMGMNLQADIQRLDVKMGKGFMEVQKNLDKQASLVNTYMGKVDNLSKRVDVQDKRNELVLKEAGLLYKEVKKEFEHNQRQVDMFLQKTEVAGSMLDYKIKGIQYTLNEFIDNKNHLLTEIASKKQNFQLYQQHQQTLMNLENTKASAARRAEEDAIKMRGLNLQNERERMKYDNAQALASQKAILHDQREHALRQDLAFAKYFK